MKTTDPSIEALRRAADEVASALPSAEPRVPRVRRTARLAFAALVLSLVVSAPFVYELVSGPQDVEVELMQVRGRNVPARVIEDEATGVILVRPLEGSAGAAMAMTGDLP